MSAPRGRRPGSPDTRDRILQAADALFARDGVEATSIRAIAREAEVDPALIRHYFTDKSGLFLAHAHIALDPRPLIRRVLSGPRDDVGERLLTTALTAWESPLGRATMRVVLAQPEVFRRFAQLITREIATVVGEHLGHVSAQERRERIAMLEAILLGLLTGRYQVGVEPLASLPAPAVVRRFAPQVQRLLT